MNIGIPKRLYYENILSIMLDTVLFGSSAAAKLAVLSRGQHFFSDVGFNTVQKISSGRLNSGRNELK